MADQNRNSSDQMNRKPNQNQQDIDRLPESDRSEQRETQQRRDRSDGDSSSDFNRDQGSRSEGDIETGAPGRNRGSSEGIE